MNYETALTKLDQEWELETGFFGRLRSGFFNPQEVERILEILRAIEESVQGLEMLDRRLVELVWHIPVYMGYQRERVQKLGGDIEEFDNAIDDIQAILDRILGLP
jgi:hypothetical protein